MTGVNIPQALQSHPDPCPAQEASGRKQSARSGNFVLALGSLLVSLLVGNVDVTLDDLLHATLFSCLPYSGQYLGYTIGIFSFKISLRCKSSVGNYFITGISQERLGTCKSC